MEILSYLYNIFTHTYGILSYVYKVFSYIYANFPTIKFPDQQNVANTSKAYAK